MDVLRLSHVLRIASSHLERTDHMRNHKN